MIKFKGEKKLHLKGKRAVVFLSCFLDCGEKIKQQQSIFFQNLIFIYARHSGIQYQTEPNPRDTA